ncbi:uncharacterized protein LOC127698342 isoform X1 [Mytilus californianus]|uniref:uncharacterized protein LOC127698342 isoform X1 n=1 Tax=Mytilus californianus TaxID=6549 RepID=UPI00224613DC|nr:uncharacterized protein LOC127698342 isoform X1 [Mytilus californianus]
MDQQEPVDNYSGYLGHDPLNVAVSTADVKFTDYLHPLASNSQDVDKNTGPVPQHPHKDIRYPQINSVQKKPVNMRELRFDSGVADLDQSISPVTGTPSPSSTFRPISTNKTYDYAEYGSHQYEELPHSRLQPNGPQMSPCSSSSDNQSSTGTTVTISDVPSDAGDTANIIKSQSQKDEEQRKRYNPLYDTMINATPSIYNKVRVTRESMLQTQIKLLRLVVVILIFISCISLSISLYLIISNSSDSSVQNLQGEVSSLKEKYSNIENRIKQVESLMAGNLSFEHLALLGEKVYDLESVVSSNFTSVDKKIQVTNSAVTLNQGNILSVSQNFTSTLSAMNNTVQDQLDIISKMPGPQGPEGVGNLTACFLQEYSQGSRLQEAQTETDEFPLDSDLKTKVVMSAYCSVVNGLYTRMEVKRPSQADYRTVKYQCICWGAVSGESFRYCKIFLWLCPRESFGGNT